MCGSLHGAEDVGQAEGMWDLTAEVEWYENAIPGTFHGIFSTCSTAAAAAWP